MENNYFGESARAGVWCVYGAHVVADYKARNHNKKHENPHLLHSKLYIRGHPSASRDGKSSCCVWWTLSKSRAKLMFI